VDEIDEDGETETSAASKKSGRKASKKPRSLAKRGVNGKN
jgi:hypothetical protein